MYSNRIKMTTAACLWGLPFMFGFLGVWVFLGVFFDTLGCPPAESAMFLFMAVLCIGVVWLYVRNMGLCMFVTVLNNLLTADEDGYVPISDLSKELNCDEVKLVNKINRAIRRGYLINLNYSAADKAVYLSDKVKAGIPLMGKPKDLPFVGVHCEGCGATLKIRVKTKGTCPFCGREIIQG